MLEPNGTALPNPGRSAVVIDDDPDLRHLIGSVLTQAGFDTITVSNGADGLAAVRRHQPLVTTLDLTLPGMDGFEVARRIRQFSSTYIMVVSALDQEIDAVRGFDAGADDFILKPFRPRELRARIDAVLRRPRTMAVSSPPGPLTQPLLPLWRAASTPRPVAPAARTARSAWDVSGTANPYGRREPRFVNEA